MNILDQPFSDVYLEKLSLRDFNRLSTFINNGFGIKMPIEKRTMLQCRLQKRLRSLNLATYKDYCDYLFSKEGQVGELIHMIDVVTTNKTDFFREPAHFDFLVQNVLPVMDSSKKIRIWSAGCSSGEEPYTLAMLLCEYSAQIELLDFEILGTDISTRMIELAANAIYQEEKATFIPINYKKKYLLRNKDKTKRSVRMDKTIRSKVSFQRINFMDSDYDVSGIFDIIFCRNVLIYFDKPTQEMVINKLCRKLRPNGFFFLGHSESIMGMNVPLDQIKPTIFQRI